MKQYIKQFFYLLDPPAKKALPILIGVFLFSSVLDVFGIGLIGIFLGLLTTPDFLSHKFPHIGSLVKVLSEKTTHHFFWIVYCGCFCF